jgi:DNA mismatch endonuclease (patch repair protein)
MTIDQHPSRRAISVPPRPSKLLPRSHRAPLTRSEVMSRIRSQNTTPEMRVRSLVYASGIRFRKHVNDLPGKPDLANRRKRWAIFVHGCFWHSHDGCSLASRPKSNATYWGPKLKGNVARDCQKVFELERLGFRVFIIWECQTRDSLILEQTLAGLLNSLRYTNAADSLASGRS